MASQVEIDRLRLYGCPDDHPEGGACRACSYCSLSRSDEVPEGEYGVCTGFDEPMVVSLDEWHAWDDCWLGRS